MLSSSLLNSVLEPTGITPRGALTQALVANPVTTAAPAGALTQAISAPAPVAAPVVAPAAVVTPDPVVAPAAATPAPSGLPQVQAQVAPDPNAVPSWFTGTPIDTSVTQSGDAGNVIQSQRDPTADELAQQWAAAQSAAQTAGYTPVDYASVQNEPAIPAALQNMPGSTAGNNWGLTYNSGFTDANGGPSGGDATDRAGYQPNMVQNSNAYFAQKLPGGKGGVDMMQNYDVQGNKIGTPYLADNSGSSLADYFKTIANVAAMAASGGGAAGLMGDAGTAADVAGTGLSASQIGQGFNVANAIANKNPVGALTSAIGPGDLSTGINAANSAYKGDYLNAAIGGANASGMVPSSVGGMSTSDINAIISGAGALANAQNNPMGALQAGIGALNQYGVGGGSGGSSDPDANPTDARLANGTQTLPPDSAQAPFVFNPAADSQAANAAIAAAGGDPLAAYTDYTANPDGSNVANWLPPAANGNTGTDVISSTSGATALTKPSSALTNLLTGAKPSTTTPAATSSSATLPGKGPMAVDMSFLNPQKVQDVNALMPQAQALVDKSNGSLTLPEALKMVQSQAAQPKATA